MKETFVNILNLSGIAWWVKISTTNPHCTYYFGPFVTDQEAKNAETGYIEDLEGEGAQVIQVSIEQCQPEELTISDELPNTKVMVNSVLS
ncbi:DUF1816 domain-containing protein [Okeania sp.]|uniref:DUF1816 domain-containing protein n=1 Tax=Okeania sp. TaxID=3100323 RepID=UPI002B4B2F48|nr:DUF1816 domain-containing protein [Okeania sp.]MEB3342282.1 DUF1816 domain-containing protein [Okeania sp.]